MVKAVIDANVMISAAFGGSPLDAVNKAFSVGRVYLSPDIVAEVAETLHRLESKLGSDRTKALLALWKRFQSLCEIVKPRRRVTICRDSKDDAYLSLCVEITADYLITGDKDLLVVAIDRNKNLPRTLKILTPRQFLDLGD
jgi:putative PIN family toxin of toxin-antitoxin system